MRSRPRKNLEDDAPAAVERLLEADAEAIARVALQSAKSGDTAMIKAVLDRVAAAAAGASAGVRIGGRWLLRALIDKH